MSEFARKLDADINTTGLQFNVDTLKSYFESSDYISRTRESWNSSTTENLGSLNEGEKQQLQTSIAEYLNTMDVALENGETCKASKLIQKYPNYEQAIQKVKAGSEKLLNITCALTSMHSFLKTGRKLQYEQAGNYAEKNICNVVPLSSTTTKETKNSTTTIPTVKENTPTTNSKTNETTSTTTTKTGETPKSTKTVDNKENVSSEVTVQRPQGDKVENIENNKVYELGKFDFPTGASNEVVGFYVIYGGTQGSEYHEIEAGLIHTSSNDTETYTFTSDGILNFTTKNNNTLPKEIRFNLAKWNDRAKEKQDTDLTKKVISLKKIETSNTRANPTTTTENNNTSTAPTDKNNEVITLSPKDETKNTTTPPEKSDTTKVTPKEEPKKEEVVVPKIETPKKIEVADTLEHKDLLNGVEVSPLYPKEDGTFERVLYKIGKDNAYHEIGKINYENDKHITAENQTIKLNLIDGVDWGTVTMNVIEKGENGDYTINFVNSKEAKTYKEKLQTQKDILKKFTISGANPERYTTLVPNTKVEDDQTKFSDDYINNLQPDFHGTYTLPLAKDRYLSFSFDEDNKLVVKNNDKQFSPRGQSYMPSKDDATKVVLDKGVYTNLDNTLVKVEVDTDNNRITFNEFETTDSENRVTKKGKQVNTIDNYYNKKKIANLPPVEVILPGFENKPFKVMPEGLNLSVENGIINLFSAGKNILRNPSDLDIPDDKVGQYHAFEANMKENGDADLFDQTLLEKPGMTKNMKNYDIAHFLHTEDKNLKPKGIRIVNPQSGAERYVSIEITNGVISNGEFVQSLVLRENTLENKKIADRMKALNTLMKRVDEVMSISTIKNNAFDKPSMVAITDDYIREQIGDKDKKVAKEDLYTQWFNKMVTNDKPVDEFIDDKGVVDFSGVTIQRKMKTKVQEYDKDKKTWITKDVIVPIDIALSKDGNIQERAYGDQTGGTVKIGKQEYYPFIRGGQLELKTEEEMNGSIQNIPGFEQAFLLPERKNIALSGHNALLSIANVTDGTKSDVFDVNTIEKNIIAINSYFALLLNDKVPEERKQKAINQYGGAKNITEMTDNLNKIFTSLYRSGKSMGTLLYIKDNVLTKIPNPSEFVKQQKEATKEVKKAVDKKFDLLQVITPATEIELDSKVKAQLEKEGRTKEESLPIMPTPTSKTE